ncbi:GDP-mannose 4,6-dehydratase [Flavobacteriaceae bacterium]|nr:GDP-mannose 4,6-dehydratase [Flavobacteriaceae bacterium]
MKILVTGTAGFIGYHLVRKLIDLGHNVVGIDNINNYYDIQLKYDRLKESGIYKENLKSSGELIKSKKLKSYFFSKLDLCNKVKLVKLFRKEKFDKVINLAAQAGVRFSIENPMAYVESNVVGFTNLLECCKEFKIKHLLYASSSSVYGLSKKFPVSEEDNVDKPISLYAATKKSNELMAYTYSHLFKIPTSGLRFFTVYGPWGRPDMAPILFANAIVNREKIKVFNEGKLERDFTYIDDITEGIVISLENPPINSSNYEIYNIGNGKPVNLLRFIQVLEKKLGKKALKKMMPMQMGDVKKTFSDISKLKSLGYNPKIKIDEGVDKFIKWFLKYNKK